MPSSPPPRPRVRSRKLRNRLLSPLVVAGALLLLLEEWCWDLGLALVRTVSAWPPFKLIDARIATLSPYPALCLFVLPAALLLPVKLLALFAIGAGYPVTGVAVFVAAKLGGAALVARVYFLTRPALLTLPWFARWHARFLAVRDDWLARLRATGFYRRAALTSEQLRQALRRRWLRLRRRSRHGARAATRPARILRRFQAIFRARRRS
ncbi:hypothetical protein [Massilia sp. DWR3-1-1]|uniref:hypothetical protein n=1 Tax=Massilia sp. DWR3-1-1 TaxID=2804559 RepID=UPI003CF870CC